MYGLVYLLFFLLLQMTLNPNGAIPTEQQQREEQQQVGNGGGVAGRRMKNTLGLGLVIKKKVHGRDIYVVLPAFFTAIHHEPAHEPLKQRTYHSSDFVLAPVVGMMAH
jgi:hypothetical protein